MTDLLPRVAKAMSDRRQELIAQPLSRIWEELAKVAIEEVNREPPMLEYDPTQQADLEDDI